MKLNTKIITTGLMTMITCALVGSITGTFAWYAYSTRATAELSGTTFGKAANLQLGIVASNEAKAKEGWATFVADSGLKQDDENSNIYWSYLGGGLSQKIIEDYLKLMGHDRKGIKPTTSGVYTSHSAVENPDFVDYEPISFDNYPYLETNLDISPKSMPIQEIEGDKEADLNDYSVLPLAIRVIDIKKSTDTTKVAMKNQDVYVSDIDFSALDENGRFSSDISANNIAKAFRIDFKTWNGNDETKASRVIVSPADNHRGTIDIGGLLDNDLDGYVDVELYDGSDDVIDYDYMVREEHLYGAIKGEDNVEYVNFSYTGQYTDEQLNDHIVVESISNNVASESLVDVSSYTGKTFYNEYLYVANPNYNVNDDTSYPYIPKRESKANNTIKWSMENISNPLLPKEYNDTNFDPTLFAYEEDNENHKLSLKELSLVADYMLVQSGEGNSASYQLVKKEAATIDPSKVYEKKNNGDGYVVRNRNNEDTANPLLTSISEYDGLVYVEDSTITAGPQFKVVNSNTLKLLDKYFICEEDSSAENAYTIGEGTTKYSLNQIGQTDKEYNVLYKRNGTGASATIDAQQERALYKKSDNIPSTYEEKVNLNGTTFDKRNHQANTYTIASYEAYKQKFVASNDFVTPFAKGTFAANANKNVVCNTGDDGVVYCKLTMWLEGWDDACDLNVLDVSYGLGIQFQIDRLDK